jgi:transcriptional regulator
VSDAPSDFIQGQMKGIYGIKLKPSRMSFKEKLSQNRNQADYNGVKKGLLQRNSQMSDLLQKVS